MCIQHWWHDLVVHFRNAWMSVCTFAVLVHVQPLFFKLAHTQRANRRKSGTDVYPLSFSLWGKPTGCSSYPQDTITASSMILEIIQSFEEKKKNISYAMPALHLGYSKGSPQKHKSGFRLFYMFPFSLYVKPRPKSGIYKRLSNTHTRRISSQFELTQQRFAFLFAFSSKSLHNEARPFKRSVLGNLLKGKTATSKHFEELKIWKEIPKIRYSPGLPWNHRRRES